MANRAGASLRSTLSHHENFLRYKGMRWLWIAAFLIAGSIIAFVSVYAPDGFHLEHAGGTWLGYTLGTIGALIILWLTTIGIRKRAMTKGHWLLKGWVSAHVYLGLSLIVVVTLHTGFRFGWDIHTTAYALMLVVIASGLVGVVAYITMPVRLSEARGDMTKKQIIEIINSLDRRLLEAAQPLQHAQAHAVQLSLDKTILAGSLTQRLFGWYSGCGNRSAIRRVARFRRRATGAQAETLERIAGLLARKQEILVRARRYARIRTYIEIWLYVHVPATFALLAALTAHIVSVFFFL